MTQALREVLAELDVEVRGLGSVDAANAELDKYVASVTPAQTEIEKLTVKQHEAAEMAQRLAQRIRRLQKAEGDNSARVLELRGAYVRAREEVKRFGVEIDKARKKASAPPAQAADLASILSSGWTRAGIAMAGASAIALGLERAVSAVVAPIREVIGIGAEIEESANRMGVGFEQYQELQFIAERTDVPVAALGKSFQKLAQQAAAGGGELRRLGVEVRDSNGQLRSQDDLFFDTIESLSGIRNETARAAAAQKIFGRSGRELLTLLAENPEKVEELRDRFRELGGGLSGDFVEAAAKADDATIDMDLAMLSLKGALAQDIVPALADVIGKLATFTGWLSDVFEHSTAGRIVLFALAGAAAALAGAILVPLALVALPFVLLALAVDDVMVAFEGGDSILSRSVEWFLELIGVSLTFRGYLDSLGVGWEELEARVLDVLANITEAIASSGLGQLLGIDASGMRASANAARIEADVARVTANIDEAFRQAQRGEAVAARRGGAKTEGKTVTQSFSANVDARGMSPAQAEHAVESAFRRMARESADELALADPEPA